MARTHTPMSKNCDFIDCLSSSITNGSCSHEQTQGVWTLLRFVNSILICHEAPDARRVRRRRRVSRKLRVLLKVVMKLLWTLDHGTVIYADRRPLPTQSTPTPTTLRRRSPSCAM